ncbi:hypothetical protein [Meiothermus sp.]|uniref:hypothetical protein n=1 Tax=Meiothermus sp. TaxID=1955249 RepID=UPI0021DDB9E9|nr:hypothetical protein [Meiothermus sp.]GIW33620.1 MAG: hypothetical protein KatS3mg072_0953 [Meiothermus sp.]
MKSQNKVWCAVAAVVLAVILVGCTTTRITSQVNREAVQRNFSKLLVHSSFQNLEYRQLAENKLCAELAAATGVTCLRSITVFFPGQKYTVEQIAERLSELQIDAVLTFQPTGSGTSSTYIPQRSYTTGSATVIGNTVIGSSTTQTYGGYNIRTPWANFEAVLWSTSDDKAVWYATAASEGNALAGWDGLISSASSKVVSKLVSDGVFRKLSR